MLVVWILKNTRGWTESVITDAACRITVQCGTRLEDYKQWERQVTLSLTETKET